MLAGVLTDQLVDRIPAGITIHSDQRFGLQPGQFPQRCAGHFSRGVACEPTSKDGQGREPAALSLVQKGPRVIEYGAHAAVPGGHVAHVGLEEVHRAPDL